MSPFFVTGTTAQEIDLRPAPGDVIRSWTSDDLHSYVAARLGTLETGLTNRSIAAYSAPPTTTPASTTHARDAGYTFTTVATDVRVTCGNNRLAALAADAMTSPVYRYVVTSCPARGARALNVDFSAKYAFHGWDIYAFFDTYESITPGSHASDADKRFSAAMQDNVLFFIKNGKPRDRHWLPYPESVALIGQRVHVNSTYNSHQCSDLWRSYFKYSWTN